MIVLGGVTVLPQAVAKPIEPTRSIVYKEVDGVALKLRIFEPEGHASGDSRPGVVFFFGGGWVAYNPKQFYQHCAYLASRGMWAAAADYRVERKHGTDPRACVRDGKSAVRYIRGHADELGVDPNRLAAGGGSAGGQVAAAAATVTGFNAPTDDTSISCVPDALVLFNPVYDNGPGGYGHDRVKDYWRRFSPMHNIEADMPPAIVFLGTEDPLIPVETGREFQKRMREAGVRSELMLFEGHTHGFFNYGVADNKPYRKTVRAMDRFLASLGFLEGQPTLE
jgi:acetyl esterase/lipase